MRQSEALALQWKDIDLLGNTLSIRRTLHRVKGGGLVYEAPKTKRSERTLALPMLAELASLAAAEQTCCSFVTWTVTEDRGSPVLRVLAKPDNPDNVASIAALFGLA